MVIIPSTKLLLYSLIGENFFSNLICGVTSGIIGAMIANPFDVVKVIFDCNVPSCTSIAYHMCGHLYVLSFSKIFKNQLCLSCCYKVNSYNKQTTVVKIM